MHRLQLISLFLCSLVIWTGGNGLLPILPIYAQKLGATNANIGFYLAISYFFLAVGVLLSGWLSDHTQQRKLILVGSGCISLPGMFALGYVESLWSLTALTSMIWFLGGMGLTATQTIAGLDTNKKNRGKIFGILTVASPLGSLLGGLTAGPLAEKWGFDTLFFTLAGFSIIWPILALTVQNKNIKQEKEHVPQAQSSQPKIKHYIGLLLISGLLVFISNFGGVMGTSLIMKKLDFSLTAISSTGIAAGLGSIPLLFVISWLSDNIGRKHFIILSNLIGAIGVGLLGVSNQLWQFWLIAIMIRMLSAVNRSVGTALIADLSPVASQGRNISLFNSMGWIGGIIGYVTTGLLLDIVSFRILFLILACFPILTIILLKPIKNR